ncbi:MAG: 1-acyl-sn-glycerol-3-phosphate acyltransferase [Treponemataceae bacterium]|nr:1-acyl-sn-glycerol-3-phosphate acyltransferase [Treponemataceae bacterium]
MKPISHVYRNRIMEMVGKAHLQLVVTEHNVYQIANKELLSYIDAILDELVLPESGIDGFEHLEELLQKAKGGASCLLLVEHYSNFDLPVLSYLLRKKSERGAEIADAIVAIAGLKLNESNPIVTAFTEAYTRIVIYPSRSLAGLDPEKDQEEIARSNAINRAAMKTLNKVKKEGKLILVFPAGTRYRPWDPESKRGVREIDSYIKSFDYFCPVAINGNVLRIQPGDMAEDLVCQDVVKITVGPVIQCHDFREQARHKAEMLHGADKKQATVDAIMALLDQMHQEAEKIRPRREDQI